MFEVMKTTARRLGTLEADKGLRQYILKDSFELPITQIESSQDWVLLDTPLGALTLDVDDEVSVQFRLPEEVVSQLPASTISAEERFMGSYALMDTFGREHFERSGDSANTPSRVYKYIDFTEYAHQVLADGDVLMKSYCSRWYLFWTHLTDSPLLLNWNGERRNEK